MKEQDEIGNVRGIVTMTFRDKATGKIVDTFKDDNLFINLGRTTMCRAIGELSTDNYVVKDLRFGDDFGDPGTYDIFNPEPAQLTFDSTTQSEVFTISRPTLTVSYPNYKSVQFSCIIDGDAILDQFPGEVDVQFNSAALYNHLDDPITYIRFSVKSISRLISVQLQWLIEFVS